MKGKGKLQFTINLLDSEVPEGWRGNFLLSAAEQWLKLELTKNFKVGALLNLSSSILR